MKLSDQAMGAIMMALQKSLMNQTDIVPMLKETMENCWLKIHQQLQQKVLVPFQLLKKTKQF